MRSEVVRQHTRAMKRRVIELGTDQDRGRHSPFRAACDISRVSRRDDWTGIAKREINTERRCLEIRADFSTGQSQQQQQRRRRQERQER